MNALNVADFEKYLTQGYVIIDTRNTSGLQHGFIKGSIALSNNIKFSELAKIFLNEKSALLVCDENEQNNWQQKLQKAGFNDIKGYLSGGFEAWQTAGLPVDMIIDVEADELMMDIPFDENLIVMDIRSEIAFGSGHLKNAINIPLLSIADPLRLSAIQEKDNLYLISNSDDEAYLAASILKKHEIHNLRIVLGGWDAVQQEQKADIVKEPGMLN